MARRVTLGRVAGVYGVRGWVRVYSQTRPVSKILDYRRWFLERDGEVREVKLLVGRAHGQGIVAQLSDLDGNAITDRDLAAGLVGWNIAVDRELLPALPDGEFYWMDLIGLAVCNEQGAALGSVRDVTSNGAQDVLVVVDEAEVERLIPFVRPQIVKEVSLESGRIVCDWELDY